MSYSKMGILQLQQGKAGFDDLTLHSPDYIKKACEAMRHYDSGNGHVTKLVDEECRRNSELLAKHPSYMAGVIAEACVRARLDWLDDECGFDVTFPIREPLVTETKAGRYLFKPSKPGRRIDLLPYNGNGSLSSPLADYDAVIKIHKNGRKTWTLIEVKGKHSFNTNDFMDKARKFKESGIMQPGDEGPAFIVFQTGDSRLLTTGGRALGRFTYKGGNVVFMQGLDSGGLNMWSNEYSDKLCWTTEPGVKPSYRPPARLSFNLR